MICISALCIVLVLSSIASSANSENRIEQLKEEISQAVVNNLIIVANDATISKMNTKELNKKLLATTKDTFHRMEPQIKELIKLSGSLPEVIDLDLEVLVIAKDLARRINQNQALKNALPEGVSPRFSGVVGTIGTIAYAIIKAITNIIIGPTK